MAIGRGKRTKLSDGYKNNNWLFIRDDGKNYKSGCAKATFECLLCNKQYERSIHEVVSGKSPSCKGCGKKKPFEQLSVATRARLGVKSLSIDEKEQMHEAYRRRYATFSFRASIMLSAARSNARRKHLPFELTKSWVISKLKLGKCEVSNVPFDFGSMRKFGPSLDRIDSKKGYTEDNSRVVVWMYNCWKSNWNDDEVLDFAKILVGKND